MCCSLAKVVWAGQETSIEVMEGRMEQSGVDFDLLGIGWGMRGGTLKPIVERFEGRCSL